MCLSVHVHRCVYVYMCVYAHMFVSVLEYVCVHVYAHVCLRVTLAHTSFVCDLVLRLSLRHFVSLFERSLMNLREEPNVTVKTVLAVSTVTFFES